MKNKIKQWAQVIRSRLPVLFPFTSRFQLLTTYRFAQLLTIVQTLRGPHGCPWDRKQTLHTIIKDLREESEEAIEALYTERPGHLDDLAEELGDVIFLVLLLAQIARDTQQFDMTDVMKHIVAKMLRRHPHVFDGISQEDTATINKRWQAIKAQEQEQKSQRHGVSYKRHSALDGIPRGLSAFPKAHKIAKRAATLGFDWPNIAGVREKITEELEELDHAIAHESPSRQQEELGDLLFSIINLARHLKLDSEEALHGNLNRFEARFRHMEGQIQTQQKSMEACTTEELERYWQQAKEATSPTNTSIEP